MPSAPWREYTLLPGPASPGSSAKRHLSPRLLLRAGITKRYARLLILAVLSLLFFIFFILPSQTSSPVPPSHFPSSLSASVSDAQLPQNLQGYPPYPDTIERNPAGPKDPYPPLYERYTAWEDTLPQNNEDAPFPDGKEAKYVFLANHQRYAGWGNALQEMILNAHLTYLTGRGFVYDNYTWDIDGPVYAGYNGHWRPSRIPITTMVAGPLGGYPFLNTSLSPETHLTPRAISKNHFRKICPDRVVMSSEGVLHTLQSDNTAKETMDAFVKKLIEMPERCVELERDSPQLFDIWIMGSSRVHDIWPVIANSPILTQFTWSPLIQRMFVKNAQHFLPSSFLPSPPSFLSRLYNSLFSKTEFTYPYTYSPADFVSPVPSLDQKAAPKPVLPAPTNSLPLPILALHVRRGDFKDHCFHLANWSSTYTGLNTLPQLPDRFVAPPRPHNAQGERINIPFPLPVTLDGDAERRKGMSEKEREEEDERYKEFVGEEQRDAVRAYERAYQVHCWPEVQDVVRRVREVVKEWNALQAISERSSSSLSSSSDSEIQDTPHADHLKKRARLPSHDKTPKTKDDATMAYRRQKLRRVYVMTNGDPAWLAEVKRAVEADAARSRQRGSSWFDFRKRDDNDDDDDDDKDDEEKDEDGWGDLEWDWDGLATTRDLDVGWEEKHVSQALDMYVGQRAEVFVGNGFSSLTANIVLLRMANGLDPKNTRFW